MTDESLMLAYRGGDAAAFDELFDRNSAYLYRYFDRQLHRDSAGRVDELFQDVWVKVMNAAPGYEPTAAFRTWLTTIAHNRLVEFYRQQSRRPEWSFDETGHDGDGDSGEGFLATLEAPEDDEPLRRIERKRACEAISEAIADLPVAQREAFILHHESGMTLDDISRAINVKKETVKSRLRFAMANLRKALADLR